MGVNYDELASRYDRHRRGGGPFLPTLVRLADSAPGDRVLEIGAGTGNNTGAMLEQREVQLVGLDASMGMLRRARQKRLNAQWLQARADTIPLAAASIDFIFAVCVLHHIDDLVGLFRECRRVLTPHGITAFVTSPHGFIEHHPMNRYFPSFAAVDKARFQDVPVVRRAMEEAGFAETGAEHAVGEARPIDEEYYERVAGRFISTYDLIPKDEFERGLADFREDLRRPGRIEETIAWECVTVWGRK